jgi:hypothetical protein
MSVSWTCCPCDGATPPRLGKVRCCAGAKEFSGSSVGNRHPTVAPKGDCNGADLTFLVEERNKRVVEAYKNAIPRNGLFAWDAAAAPMGRSEDRGGWARRRTAKTGVAFTPILLERPCRTRLAIARGAARNPRDSALQNCFLGHPRRWRIGLSWVSQVSPLSPSEILEPIRRQLRVAHVCWMFLCPSGVGTHSRVLCLKSGLST